MKFSRIVGGVAVLTFWVVSQVACGPAEPPAAAKTAPAAEPSAASTPSVSAIRKVAQAAKDKAEREKDGQGAKDGKGAGIAKKGENRPPDYFRLTKDAQGNLKALEVAITRFAPADPAKRDAGPTVDLVGAIHVAEPEYYERLNREFKDYDVVLYELVAPEGSRPVAGNRSGNALSGLQDGMSSVLKLKHQLDGVDYHQPHFVHADLSPDELVQSMRDRQESLAAMLVRAMGYAMAREAGDPMGGSNAELFSALFAKDQSLALRRAMARQMAEMGGMLQAMEGPKGSSIIAERNKRALSVLREQIKLGKKKIAIFYGAGHMPDFEKRLAADFALARQGIRWLPAWDLSEPKGP